MVERVDEGRLPDHDDSYQGARVKEPAMPFSHLPAFLTSVFAALAHWLDKRTAAWLPLLLAGVLFARGCRTVTSWFRAAGISADFRQSYVAVCAVGRESDAMAISVVTDVVRPLLKAKRLMVGIDDTPTQRRARSDLREGAGIHHHPSPAPSARSTSTATSGSFWPLWPNTTTGVPSPCPYRRNSTSATSMWNVSLRNAGQVQFRVTKGECRPGRWLGKAVGTP
jgi:hypothetical protein